MTIYKLTISVFRESNCTMTTRVFKIEAASMEKALEKARRYAFLTLDDAFADYISLINIERIGEI